MVVTIAVLLKWNVLAIRWVLFKGPTLSLTWALLYAKDWNRVHFDFAYSEITAIFKINIWKGSITEDEKNSSEKTNNNYLVDCLYHNVSGFRWHDSVPSILNQKYKNIIKDIFFTEEKERKSLIHAHCNYTQVRSINSWFLKFKAKLNVFDRMSSLGVWNARNYPNLRWLITSVLKSWKI